MALADSRQPAPRPAGVLWPREGQDVFDLSRWEQVPEPLSLVVHHLWSVVWRRAEAAPFRSRVLPHPTAHLTFEDAHGGRLHGHPVPASLVHGVVTTVFTLDLPVAGRVTAAAFQPGALSALTGTPAADLVDRVAPAAQVFGDRLEDLSAAVLAEPEEATRRELLLVALADLLAPELDRITGDTAYATVRAAVDLMRRRDHRTLAPVAERVHVSPRTLQRRFFRYLGVSPLSVLRRYRLQDAAALLDAGQVDDLAGLAADLGFADQAHFTRAFTAMIGVPPSRYRTGEHGSRASR